MEENIYFSSKNELTINRGISGDIAAHMKYRLKADVLQLSLENLILLAGTNDIAAKILENREEEDIVREVYSDIIYMINEEGY